VSIQKLDKVGNFNVLSRINRVFHKVKQTWHYKSMFIWFMGHDWKYRTKKRGLTRPQTQKCSPTCMNWIYAKFPTHVCNLKSMSHRTFMIIIFFQSFSSLTISKRFGSHKREKEDWCEQEKTNIKMFTD
jgi:hypothetical protein